MTIATESNFREAFERDGFCFPLRALSTEEARACRTKLRDAAVLVRGRDDHGHFDLLSSPKADLDAAALAAHRDSTGRLVAAIYSGTDKTELRA